MNYNYAQVTMDRILELLENQRDNLGDISLQNKKKDFCELLKYDGKCVGNGGLYWLNFCCFLFFIIFAVYIGIGNTDKNENVIIAGWFFFATFITTLVFVIFRFSIKSKRHKKNILVIDTFKDDLSKIKNEINEKLNIKPISYQNPKISFKKENQDICFYDWKENSKIINENNVIVENYHVILNWNDSKYSIENRNISYITDRFEKYYNDYFK